MRRSKQAFTLIELLLSVVLMAVLLVVLYSSVYSGVKSQRSVMARLGEFDSTQWGLELFKADVQNMRQISTAGGGILCKAIGSQRDNYNCRLWVSTADGVKIADWFFVPPQQAGEGFLARRLSNEDQTQVTYEVILTGLTGVEWKFYDGSSWTNVWESKTALPKLVELKLLTSDIDDQSQAICVEPLIQTPLIGADISGGQQ